MAEETRFSWAAFVTGLIGAIVGGAISIVGGYFSNMQQASSQLKITQVQHESQMKQLLFSNKIAALKSLGAAISKPSSTVALSLMDLHTHTSLLTANSSREATIQAFKAYDKAIREMINWKREIGQEVIIIEVLSKIKQPQIESLKVDVPNLTEDSFNILADEKERDRAISLIKKNEEIMLAHASKIASEFRTYLDKVSNILLGDNP